MTNYTDPSINFPDGITAGPDGALWFTNEDDNSIGRITTDGVVTNYTDPSINFPDGITAGPDGALWFTNEKDNSIGRITTDGVVTNYTDPRINFPDGITAGPDGASGSRTKRTIRSDESRQARLAKLHKRSHSRRPRRSTRLWVAATSYPPPAEVRAIRSPSRSTPRVGAACAASRVSQRSLHWCRHVRNRRQSRWRRDLRGRPSKLTDVLHPRGTPYVPGDCVRLSIAGQL